MAYKKAPYFHSAYPVIEKCILNDEINLSKYIDFSIKQICDYLSINTKISKSSNILKEESLKAQDRIIYINQVKKSTIYINPIGGLELYNKEDFLNNNIELYFLKTNQIIYKQFKNEFVPNLSIIDVMMFNNKEEIKKILEECVLV